MDGPHAPPRPLARCMRYCQMLHERAFFIFVGLTLADRVAVRIFVGGWGAWFLSDGARSAA